MALVYRALDRELERPVAVKVLADNLSADPELRRRFAREARLAARLSHPNVVRVLATGEADGRAFIVLEYVDGPNLGEELRRAGRIDPARAADLGAQAAAALAHAHEHGLVHRDVKPQNLLLAPGGSLKVSDFGIARLVGGTELTRIGTVLGTAGYLAPELLEGRPASEPADVWALGVVLYELLTGEPLFPASTPGQLGLSRAHGDPPPPSSLAPGVPAELDALVLACLRREPALRPTARQVELTLRGELDPPTVVLPASPEARTSVLRPRRGRRRTALGAGAVAVAGLALGLGLGLGRGGQAETPPAQRQEIAPIAPSSTAAEEARNLARWLRARAG